MNSRQIQYAIKLSETMNFSHVAEQLNISQPALSKQIMLLEKDLGVKLFDRSKTPLQLTPAGEYFIREARRLLSQEEQLARSMSKFQSGEFGRLVIGVSPFRSLYMIPAIAARLHEAYPGVQIVLHETDTASLRKEAVEQKYDFAIVNLPVDESVLEVIPLEPDTLVLAVPNAMLDKIPVKTPGNVAKIDLKACKELPFVTVGKSQEMRLLFEKMCAAADFVPHIAMEVVGITTAWAMAHAGVGATLVPLQFISEEEFGGSVTLFRLKNNAFYRRPAIVYPRGQFLPEYAQEAIRILKKRSADSEQT